MLYGSARITAIDEDGKSFVADVNKNDLLFSPAGSRIRFKALTRWLRIHACVDDG